METSYAGASDRRLRRRLADLKESHEELCSRHQRMLDETDHVEDENERLREALIEIHEEAKENFRSNGRAVRSTLKSIQRRADEALRGDDDA